MRKKWLFLHESVQCVFGFRKEIRIADEMGNLRTETITRIQEFYSPNLGPVRVYKDVVHERKRWKKWQNVYVNVKKQCMTCTPGI